MSSDRPGCALVLLLAAIASYCLFSTAEVVLIKSLDRMAVVLPVLSCLCENGYWPAQGLMYLSLRKRSPNARPTTWKTTRGYIVIGCMASATSLLRCVGINGLPGSVYVVASCSDVVFNTMLNKVCLKKMFLGLHYVAVLLTCLALVILTQSSEAPGTLDHHHVLSMHNVTASVTTSALVPAEASVGRRAQESAAAENLVPLLAVLASALCSASNSVLSDFLFSKDTQKGLLACTEASFYNSLIPFCVMPFVMFATGKSLSLSFSLSLSLSLTHTHTRARAHSHTLCVFLQVNFVSMVRSGIGSSRSR
jgi:drug/metabolite transporter (DMT)-like permease